MYTYIYIYIYIYLHPLHIRMHSYESIRLSNAFPGPTPKDLVLNRKQNPKGVQMISTHASCAESRFGSNPAYQITPNAMQIVTK